MPKLLTDLKSFYKTSARHTLPWRKTNDPYKILVSEIMLQQTQVARVLPKYEAFLKAFPTAEALAKAPLSKVLSLWSGLGYNRRAKFLQQAAKRFTEPPLKGEMNGSPTPFRGGSATKRTETLRENSLARERVERDTGDPRTFSRRVSVEPYTTEFLESLPGVGPYTARAVAAFAYNRKEVFVETNIRTVFIHYCFKHRRKLDSLVSDKEILPLVEEALQKSRMQPRDFYAALMDYGSYLKQKGIKLNAKSKHYAKQSTFKGSYRELRGMIIKTLLKKPLTVDELVEQTQRKKDDVARQLAALSSEGIIGLKKKKFAILD